MEFSNWQLDIAVPPDTPKPVPICERLILVATFAFVAGLLAIAQDSAPQERLTAAKQAIAENQRRLHQYQWTETTQLPLKGDPKPSVKGIYASQEPVRPLIARAEIHRTTSLTSQTSSGSRSQLGFRAVFAL